jgi:hypothetical protein
VCKWRENNSINAPIGGVKLEARLADELEELGLVLVVEGRVAAEQDKDDDAQTPHIHGLAVCLCTNISM